MRVYVGDCLAVLRTMPDASIDAIVTDPPYGLAEHKPATVAAAVTAWASGDREQVPDGKGFMGRAWDGFVPPPAVWDECLRVLKPGGHMLVFAGSRTVDLMGLSIRLAGFELRDEIMWCYGSGFPKSLDVSKAIDKAGGVSPQVQASVLRTARERAGLSRDEVAKSVGCTPASVRDWEEGRARAVGRAVEYITPSPDYRDKLADLLGYTADERQITGATTDRRGDGTVIGLGHSGAQYGDATTDAAKQWAGFGTALKPAHEPILVCRKPLAGTVAANVQEHGTGALNIDATRVAHASAADLATSLSKNPGRGDEVVTSEVYGAGRPQQSVNTEGRWPTNVVLVHSPDCDQECAEGCPVAEMDRQSGVTRSSDRPRKNTAAAHNKTASMGKSSGDWTTGGHSDSGGASRFFPSFKYQAKAPTKERPKVDGKSHPTVKPLELMRWLVRLVGGQPGSVILDPFAGTGTTGQAAQLEGFRAVLIERDELALRLIRERLAGVELEVVEPVVQLDPTPPTLFDLIAQADGDDEFSALFEAHEDEWTDEHTAMVKQRLGIAA